MANRSFSTSFLVSIGIIAGVVLTATAQQVIASFSHSGFVLSMTDRSPVSASVTAWAQSQPTERDSNCAVFGDAPLDSQVSNSADGGFTISIDTANPTYTLAYCANGYHPRFDRGIPNFLDGSEVIPTPAQLFPTGPSEVEFALANDRVVSEMIRALNDLSYLRSVNFEAFSFSVESYLKALPEGASEREAVSVLLQSIDIWNGRLG